MSYVNSPVGTWNADGDDHATLRIDDDGTFTIAKASFDITTRQPTRSEFDGTGDWGLTSDGESILLDFTSASLSGFDLQTHITLERSFQNGSILFEDPEQTHSITFRLQG